MKYRPEIDGLRALAVFPVVLFHAGIAHFEGGYLGVDVFFVISGYLITTIIAGELAEGRFSLRRFYDRRARRILPALMVVILSCLPAAWVLLPGRDAQDFAQSLIAVLLFASNFLFYVEAGYFDTISEFKPLLHSWSLAVEEQFYIFYPLGLILIWRFARNWLALLLCLALLLSLGAAVWADQSDPALGFFLAPTRFWQLLIGALCALAMKRRITAIDGLAGQALGIAGLFLIGLAMAIGGPYPASPTLLALIATIGTALIIVFAQAGTIGARILALPLLVRIGLVSYGFYLWHQPLLAFYRHIMLVSRDPELDRAVELAPLAAGMLIAASLGLAVLTYHTVEKPFRSRTIGAKHALGMAFAAYAVVAAFALLIHETRSQEQFYLLETRAAKPDQVARHFAIYDQIHIRIPATRRDNGDCVFLSQQADRQTVARIAACYEKYGPGTLLIGDSHAMNLHNVAYHLAAGRTFRVSLVKGACNLPQTDCLYGAAERKLLAGPVRYFNRLIYHQAGSNLIADRDGMRDSQLAFTQPRTAGIWPDGRAIVGWLARVQRQYDLDVVFVGPFYEPRINIENYQHVLGGWVPRQTIVGQFRELDAILLAHARAADVRYISLLDDALIFSASLTQGNCLLYRDLDHLTLCGERRLSGVIERTGHPFAGILAAEEPSYPATGLTRKVAPEIGTKAGWPAHHD